MKKLVKLLTLVLVTSVFFTACSDKNKEAGEGSKENKPQQAEAFNPDSDPNGVDYNEIREKLGAVPKTEEEIKLGSVAKAFENEYWRTLKEGEELGAQKFREKG